METASRPGNGRFRHPTKGINDWPARLTRAIVAAEFATPALGETGMRVVWAVLLLSLLGACSNVETRTLVTKSDLPNNGYRRVVIFVENISADAPRGTGLISYRPYNKADIQEPVIEKLKSAGVVASQGEDSFSAKSLSNQQKAQIIQKNFDAVLYINVLVNDKREELIENARHDGRTVWVWGEARPVEDVPLLILKPDGTVWNSHPTLQLRADIQDTKTNKTVWSAETIATGGTAVLNTRVAEDIVQRLRADGVI
jgi:hypothetical protein